MPKIDLITELASNERTEPSVWLKRLWESPKVDRYLHDLAKELGCHLKTARGYLLKYGLVAETDTGLYRKKAKDTVWRRQLLEAIVAQGYPEGTSVEVYLTDMIQKGFGTHLIAERWGTTPATVRNWAMTLGLTLPIRSNPEHRRPVDGLGNDIGRQKARETIKERYSKHYTTTDGRTFTLREISEKTGVTRSAVLYRIRNWGVDRAVDAEKQTCRN